MSYTHVFPAVRGSGLVYHGLLDLAGQQQAARLRVEGARLAAHRLVALAVEAHGQGPAGRDRRGVHAHRQAHPLGQTQTQPGERRESMEVRRGAVSCITQCYAPISQKHIPCLSKLRQ